MSYTELKWINGQYSNDVSGLAFKLDVANLNLIWILYSYL